MELYKEMMCSAIRNTEMESLPHWADGLNQTMYQALIDIKRILEDDSLCDQDCFQKIEEIVCVFERLGSNCGNRHDV